MTKAAFAGVLSLALFASAAGAATFQIVAETGTVAPGTGGETFVEFGVPALNDAGETAFYATLTGPGVTGANDSGIFTSAGLVAREGDVLPGTGGRTFVPGSFFTALNNAGETAFRGALPGNPRPILGIFTGAGLVAREGDVALGTGGATFDILSFGDPAFNDAGETAFHSDLEGTGVTSAMTAGSSPAPVLWRGRAMWRRAQVARPLRTFPIATPRSTMQAR